LQSKNGALSEQLTGVLGDVVEAFSL